MVHIRTRICAGDSVPLKPATLLPSSANNLSIGNPQAASRNFLDDLKGKSSDLVRRLGMVGYIAKGLVIVSVGVLVIVAASHSEPSKATGLDGALKTLGAQPYVA